MITGRLRDEPTRPKVAAARLALAALASMVACGAPRAAAAPPSAAHETAEVLIVLASEAPGTIDPRLADLPALQRAPFSALRSMKLLAHPKVRLTEGEDVDVDLPNGRQLRLRLVQVLPDARYRVKVSINRPGQKDYLPLLQVVASRGDPFFVAGQRYADGTLIVGVRVGEAPKPAR
ncbi:MAG: hypothetical protein KC543_17565 [Myxococcales bacterium]|nr:hypothetical protein [Myxococcales bacterium]